MTCFPTRPSLLLVLAGLFLVNQLAANQALGQTGPASGGAGGSVGGGTLVPLWVRC